jgi:hypothetical protein
MTLVIVTERHPTLGAFPRGDPERSVVGVHKDSVIGGRVSEHPVTAGLLCNLGSLPRLVRWVLYIG